MIKMLQARLQQYINFQMFKLDFEKAEKPETKLNIRWIIEKAGEFQKKKKNLFLLSWLFQSLQCVNHNKLWNILKEWEYQTTWSASWKICMQVKKPQLALIMEQQTGSKLGKEYIKAVYCHSAYLTYMQGTSWEMLGWRKHKLESRLPGEI